MTLLCRHHATTGRVLRRRFKEDVMKTNLNLDSALRTFARLTNLAKLNKRDKVPISLTALETLTKMSQFLKLRAMSVV